MAFFWRVKVPAKVDFLVWMVAHKILTEDNFRKTKMIIIDWCCIVHSDRVTRQLIIIFLHGAVSRVFWSMVLFLWDFLGYARVGGGVGKIV